MLLTALWRGRMKQALAFTMYGHLWQGRQNSVCGGGRNAPWNVHILCLHHHSLHFSYIFIIYLAFKYYGSGWACSQGSVI